MELGSRQKRYEDAYNIKLTNKLPVVIRVDGRNFSRVTKKLPKPYCSSVMDIMSNTMFNVAKEIEGAVFAYQQSDEITFILKNDQSIESQPWFGNRIQKISSITSSFTTYYFNHQLNKLNNKLNIITPIIFDARVFILPSITEVINNLIWRQQDCISNAVSSAAYAEITRQLGKKNAQNILSGKSVKERLLLLKKECGIDFDKYYPISFRRGTACYKIPKMFDVNDSVVTRNKWYLNLEPPIFMQNKDFLYQILLTGKDIFREENIQ